MLEICGWKPGATQNSLEIAAVILEFIVKFGVVEGE